MTPSTRALSESIGYCISGMLASDLKYREVISPCHHDEGLGMYRRYFTQYSQTSGELSLQQRTPEGSPLTTLLRPAHPLRTP